MALSNIKGEELAEEVFEEERQEINRSIVTLLHKMLSGDRDV